MTTTTTPRHTLDTIAEQVVDVGFPVHVDGPDGDPYPGACTVHVRTYAASWWRSPDGDGPTRYVEGTTTLTVCDHSERDHDGRSGVAVARISTTHVHGLRTLTPVALAVSGWLADVLDARPDVPDHCRHAVARYLDTLVAAGLATVDERARLSS